MPRRRRRGIVLTVYPRATLPDRTEAIASTSASKA
jgi:hypothetical protein